MSITFDDGRRLGVVQILVFELGIMLWTVCFRIIPVVFLIDLGVGNTNIVNVDAMLADACRCGLLLDFHERLDALLNSPPQHYCDQDRDDD